MTIRDISDMPTVSTQVKNVGPQNKIHESVFRSFQILEKVKYLLRMQCPVPVIRELIEEMECNHNRVFEVPPEDEP